MDISYLLKVLWRKKWILIVIPLVAALCAFLVKSQLPQYYKSSTQLSTGFTLGEQISFSDERFSSNDVGLKFSNLIEIINSKMVVSLVSYQLMLNDLKGSESFRSPELEGELLNFYNEEREKIIQTLEYKLKNFELLTSFDPFEKKLINLLGAYGYNYESLIDNLEVSRVGLSDFIVIEFLSEDPELSASVVNIMSEELFRYNSMLKSNRSGESVEFFEELVAQKRTNLNEKAEALKTFKASRNVLNVEMEGESTLEQIQKLEDARQVERGKIYKLQLSIQNVNNRLNGKTGGGTSNNLRILNLKEDINRINSQIRSGGGSNLQDSLDYYRQELQNEMADSYSASGSTGMTKEELIQERNALQIELAVANSSLRSINSTIETLRGSVSGYANTESTIKDLQREVDEATDEYNVALERYNSAKNTSLISNSSLKQVIAGQPAGEPESSKTILITVGAWFASFMLCAFAIVGIELMDLSLKLPAQFERVTNIPLIGYLNRIPKQTDLNDLLTSVNQNVDLRKFNHLLKKLRYDIEMSKSKVFMVTSTKEFEGKTFFIVSLSYSLSLINKKVLLIDTNFKNNSLTQIFLSNSKTLKALEEHNYVKSNGSAPVELISEGKTSSSSSYSEEKEEAPYNFDGIISKTGIKGIDIVGSRGGEYSPAEIFSSKNFHDLIDVFAKEYDYIILEGTSLNEYSDSKELSEYVDKVIAVFSAYSKIGSNDKESIEFLKSLGPKFLGGVLNNVAIEDIKI
jgi:polysaccharide biosynthesis transport protein